MNKAQRDRAVHHMEKALAALKAMPVTMPCGECLHMLNGRCLHWNAEVPVEAQPAGCHHWEEAIPF